MDFVFGLILVAISAGVFWWALLGTLEAVGLRDSESERLAKVCREVGGRIEVDRGLFGNSKPTEECRLSPSGNRLNTTFSDDDAFRRYIDCVKRVPGGGSSSRLLSCHSKAVD